jgi:hypothetical protein
VTPEGMSQDESSAVKAVDCIFPAMDQLDADMAAGKGKIRHMAMNNNVNFLIDFIG